MNIIEAARALEAGKTVVDPVGNRRIGVPKVVGTLVKYQNGDLAWMWTGDLLSEKWTVADD